MRITKLGKNMGRNYLYTYDSQKKVKYSESLKGTKYSFTSTMYPKIDDKFQEETKRENITLNYTNPCTKDR